MMSMLRIENKTQLMVLEQDKILHDHTSRYHICIQHPYKMFPDYDKMDPYYNIELTEDQKKEAKNYIKKMHTYRKIGMILYVVLLCVYRYFNN